MSTVRLLCVIMKHILLIGWKKNEGKWLWEQSKTSTWCPTQKVCQYQFSMSIFKTNAMVYEVDLIMCWFTWCQKNYNMLSFYLKGSDSVYIPFDMYVYNESFSFILYVFHKQKKLYF